MKKTFIVGVSILLLVVALTGCQKFKDVKVPKESMLGKEGKIEFERVKYEDLNSEIQTNIDANKKNSGHMLIKDELNDYLVVFAGEKNSSGYDIEIIEVMNDKGTTNVKVIETAPGKDMVTACVMTYPMDIIKLEGITDNINVVQENVIAH